MKRRYSIIVAAVLGASVIAGAAFGGLIGIAGGADSRGPSALKDSRLAPAQTPAGALDLAAAVNRWQDEAETARRQGPGRAVVGQTSQLLRGVGSERDTVNAFPTEKGLVCFEIRAAGTCGQPEPIGVTYAILSTPDSTRIYGVASDRVAQVQVDVGGELSRAVLKNNGYYHELDPGTPRNAIKGLVATWDDGSKHELPIRLN